MKKTILFFAIFTAGINGSAESSVVADLKERNKIDREWQTSPMSPEEIRMRMKEIEDRVRPIVEKEFAKLAEGEVTPLARELLQSPEAMAFSGSVLTEQIRKYSSDVQSIAWNAAFKASPDALRTEVVLHFRNKVPTEAFFTQEVQDWLVETINGGTPAGVYYFILTDASAVAVAETAKANMKQFSKKDGWGPGNLFRFLSVVFLASRGDEDALELLDSLLEKRDPKSFFDRVYLIPAAVMSGNETLIQIVREIITTDKHSELDDHYNTVFFVFADNAARVLFYAIEDFPSFRWANYDNDDELNQARKVVHDWLDENPAHTFKPGFALSIIGRTSFQSVITAMLQGKR
jgi:hypothetical protein